MVAKLFDNISIGAAKIIGYYPYDRKNSEAGVYISAAMAAEFSLPRGLMSERTFADFVMCSVGGVNGTGLKYASDLLFRKANGEYITVSYVPISENKSGYLQKDRHRKSKKYPPL